MQDEQNNLDREILDEARHCGVKDIGFLLRHLSEESSQLSQSIHDSTSQAVNTGDAKQKSKNMVTDTYSQGFSRTAQRPTRTGFFHRLFAALHHSRRLQAAAVMGQYAHLVDPACGYQPRTPTKGVQQMSANEPPSPATKAWFSLGVKILVAAVLLGFVALHIVGDAVWRAPLAAAKADSVGSNHYGD